MSPQTSIPQAPVVPSGRDIYDAIMKNIEPELLSSELPLLKQKYGDEAGDVKAKRMARYAKAFAKYDEAYETYMTHLRQQVREYRHASFKWVEEETNGKENAVMNQLEQQMLS